MRTDLCNFYLSVILSHQRHTEGSGRCVENSSGKERRVKWNGEEEGEEIGAGKERAKKRLTD